MAPPMPEYHGSLVAFEGPADAILTQLRLLPTSAQILILPGVQSYISGETTKGAFDAAAHIRRIHDAATARTAAATTFLRDATPDSKRLVFLHGGTPSAYALCVDALAENETGGDRRRAESLFRDMIAPGLAGLSSRKPRRRNQRGLVLDECALFQAQFQDPITRAMRAADALDEQTASLQPDSDLALCRPRPRSMSLPVYSYLDTLGDSAPFYVFGAGVKEEPVEEAIEEEGIQGRSFFLQSPGLTSCFYDDQEEMDPPEPLRTPPLTPGSPSCMGEAYRRSRYSSLMPDDGQSVAEGGDVVFGEASLVRVSKEAPRRNLKRARSLDSVTARCAKYRDLPLRLQSTQLNVAQELRRFSCVDVAHERLPMSPMSQRHSIFGSPKTVFVKPARSALRESALPARSSYVDRGTDAEEGSDAEGEPFEPILPFSEDLVVYFKDECPDLLLESLIGSFRDGTYPPDPPPVTEETPRASTLGCLMSSALHESTPPRTETDASSITQFMEDITRPIALEDDYDPFAYDKQPSWTTPPKATIVISAPTTPPTPAQTPPPPPTDPPPPPPTGPHDQQSKIYDFHTAGCHTAVALQNALRSVLEEHFPIENSSFRQFSFHQLPELGGLWKPVFRDDGRERGAEGRTVDQVIAIGAQAGVKNDFVSGVSRRLERLAGEAVGAPRSGRLDFRYLIANAMQSFTARPLAKQTENPFNSPYLLATLVIPHLETYLAAHSSTRLLLLEYPPDHLSTVLAIQRLVGLDLVKVAQIVDSASPKPLPFEHVRGSPIHAGHLSPPKAPASPPSPPRQAEDSLPFTKANFLLTSSASEPEIADFVDTVSKILAEISPLYNPRPSTGSKRSKVSRSSGTYSPFPRSTASPTPSVSPSARAPRCPPSPARSDRSQLAGETRGNTPSSARSHFALSQKGSPPGAFARRDTVVSRASTPRDCAVEVDEEEEELSDLDFELEMEEKRLMPSFIKRERKIGSHKALKFLGLA